MPSCELPAIAVIADAHFHDIDSDYDFSTTPFCGKSGTLRSWTDTRRSSRVFNESAAALKSTLNDIEHRGIRHVVLLGDYTDDGQVEATQRLATLLHEYRRTRGMQFYAIPGNHECYGPAGKHQSTRFVTTPGNTVLVTSDSEVAATQGSSAILTRKMYCEGTPSGLLPMGEFGLFRQSEYLHWETPFGSDDSVASRTYPASSADGQTVHPLMDASYLVEPVEGLWLLLIDANVFEPRNGRRDISRKKAFLDCSDAGWNSLVNNRPYLLDWISDVCARARQKGKSLLSFSHYPVLDPFNDWSESESRLFGQTETLRRRPGRHVAEALMGAGLQLHVGGHLHVNGLSTIASGTRQLTDIAVPSLVAFPPAYKILRSISNLCHIETVSLYKAPLDPWLISYYRAENAALGRSDDASLSMQDHGSFLYQRMYSRITQHYLPRDWPSEIVRNLENRSTADLACYLIARRHSSVSLQFGCLAGATLDSSTRELESLVAGRALSMGNLDACSMVDLIVDWYCLRQAGYQAKQFMQLDRLALYYFLSQEFGDMQPDEGDSTAAFFAVFLGAMHQSLQRLTHPDSLTDIIELQA